MYGSSGYGVSAYGAGPAAPEPTFPGATATVGFTLAALHWPGTLTWNVETSSVTADGGAGTWDYAGRSFVGATATMRSSQPGNAIWLAIPNARWYVESAFAYAGVPADNFYFYVGDYMPGDPFEAPLQAFVGLETPVPISEVHKISLDMASVQAGEMGADLASMWVSFAIPFTMSFSMSLLTESGAAYPGALAVYKGTSLGGIGLADLVATDYPLSSPYLPTIAFARYWVRVSQTALVGEDAYLHLSVENLPFQGEVYATDVDQAPGVTTITGYDFAANDVVRLSGALTETIVADSFGDFSQEVEVSERLAGTYVVTATGYYGATSTSFLVLRNPDSVDSWPDDDTPAPPPMTTTKWYMWDPVGVLDPFEFPNNPSMMSSPHAPIRLTEMPTVSEMGTPILYEGGDIVTEWQFSGILLTQEWHDALISYGGLGHRFWLRDHRGRIWTVMFQAVEMVPHYRIGWTFDYTITALVYNVIAPLGAE